MKAIFGIGDDFPSVNPRAISGGVIGLQTVAGSQFDVGHHKIELQTPLVTVLDPQTVVLVTIEAG
ncbi:hypothetical protein [Kushneria avicenniae]|uniref:hypothetical protein n=1 Tax=Kushneria avicenniae TaxID=402385 RepID=UPI001FE140F5|nr:hypothetical protein [Kushneria avicenniae]